MEPYIQPTWAVTYHDNEGHEQTITVGAEGREEAISAASPQVKGLATWYFLRAERVQTWRVEDKSENVLFEGAHEKCREYCWSNNLRFTEIPNWHKFVATPRILAPG